MRNDLDKEHKKMFVSYESITTFASENWQSGRLR